MQRILHSDRIRGRRFTGTTLRFQGRQHIPCSTVTLIAFPADRGLIIKTITTHRAHQSSFRATTPGTRYPTNVPDINLSPNAQIPADHTSNIEVIQKKLIDCPISNHDPVSVTWKKKVTVITKPDRFNTTRKSIGNQVLYSPSVIVSAMRNSENGGRSNLAFIVANTEARITNGATILNIYKYLALSASVTWSARSNLTNNAAMENGLKMGINR